MTTSTIFTRFVVKRDTAAHFSAANTLLLQGEWALETDTGKLKMGDGVTAWNSLAYVTTDKIPEGTTNKYYTDERAQDAVAAMIAAGTHSGISFAYDDANNKISATVSGGAGNMTLVATSTVTGAAATNITFSGLDLATDGTYYLTISGLNATASAVLVNLFYNGDFTGTNYFRNFLVASNSAISAGRSNNANAFDLAASAPFAGSLLIKADTSGYPRCITSMNRELPSAVVIQFAAHIRNNTANVTSLTLNTSVASAFAIGTTAKLYKIT